MGKWSKYAKRNLCMLLSTAMVLTDAGMSVSAAESTAAAERIEENFIEELIKSTEEGADQEKTADSADKETQDAKAAETESAESQTTGIETESAVETKVEEKEDIKTEAQESKDSVTNETETAEERTTQGTESELEENTIEESTIEESTEERTSAEESKTETASSVEIETAESQETQAAEMTVEELLTEEVLTDETETETEVQETETQEVLAEDVIAQGEYKEDGNDITWVIDLDGKLTVTGTGDFAPNNLDSKRAPWYEYRESIITAEIHVQNMINARGMFYGCTNLLSVDISDFDTSKVEDMGVMFIDCSSLKNIDLSNFDTSESRFMTNMFSGCSSLTNIDLSSFNTENVVGMTAMFAGCSSLTSLDLSNFNMGNVSATEYMFSGCNSLTSIEFGNFPIHNVEYMYGMFSGCSSLTSLDLGMFYTGNTRRMDSMFQGCRQLTQLNIRNFHTENVVAMDSMFAECSSLTSINLSEFRTDNVQNMNYMFFGCSNLTNLDLSGFNTEKVITMEEMFGKCHNMESLNISGFNVTNVTNMKNIFRECQRLKSLDLTNFYCDGIENDTDLISMLFECDSLCQINTPNNLTVSIELPEGTWQNSEGNIYTELPKGIESILLTKEESTQFIAQGTYQEDGNDIAWTIDTNGKLTVTGTGDFAPDDGSDVDSERAPWENYRKEIKSAEINVTGMTNASSMFWGCREMTTVDLSNFDTSQIVNMGGMFMECTSLERLDLSSFDTSNVKRMHEIFTNCRNLRYLDLSSFDLSAIEYGSRHNIFGGCTALIELKTPRNIPEDGLGRLPQGALWKDSDGNKYSTFPMGPNSVTLTKEEIEGIIAYGEYKENGNDTAWEIDTNGKLTVTGYGEFAPNGGWIDERAPWSDYRGSIQTAEVHVQGMTNASAMFYECRNLTSVNFNDFDTSTITNMSYMFDSCNRLTSMDVSGFDTSNVISMSSMFAACSNLTNLDVSSFDTSKVIFMISMFQGCIGLTDLDVSGFDTSKVTDMAYMFADCSNLASLDLSNLDFNSVTDMYQMFNNDSSLTQLYTPKNVHDSAELPSYGTWYDIKGNEYIELPQDRSDSILLARDERPSECITATKRKTSYRQWDKIDTSDLTVKYHNSDGDIITLSASDYTTNADQIDTSILGTQVLTVTYNGLTAEINLTITERIRTSVNLTGIASKDYTYSKKPVALTVLAKADDGTDVTSEIKDILVCTYTGTQADGTEYTTSNVAPTNAGEYTLTVVIPEDNQDYTGSSQTFDFTIKKAQVTITASDISLTTGAAIPKPEDYKYTISSPATEEDLEKKPTLTCNITDTSKEGTYDIVVADAALKANPNYETEIKYVNGKVEVAAYYTVTFDLSGKGESTTQKDIKKGSTISKPADPQAEGFIFTGWYKDKDCTAKWDFAADKIESDTTLYAGWTVKEEEDKDDEEDNKDESSEDKDDSAYTSEERVTLASVGAEIAAVKSKVYDGTAYRPGVKVTAVVNGRKVTLTEGTDYRVLYKNNINAGQATVTVKGNGIYKGERSRNYTITAKPVNKLKVVTGGVAGSTSGSDIQNLPVYVYDGAVLLKSGTDYTLSGYSAGSSTARVTVTGKANYTGTTTAKLTVYNVSSDKIINPENVTLNVQSVPYTGKSIKNVEPTVKIGGSTLTKNKDYKVQYQNNKNAGTAFVIVTGKGAYKGKAVIPFTIKAVNTGNMNIKSIPAKTYNGKLQKPSVTVTVNSKKLSKDKDYTITYKDNLHAGTATVVVTGKGNYAGMKGEAKFTINPQKISKASVKGTQGKLILTYSKRTLKEGTDYEKPVYGTASKNKIKVTIKGKKDFTGEVTKSVKIR